MSRHNPLPGRSTFLEIAAKICRAMEHCPLGSEPGHNRVQGGFGRSSQIPEEWLQALQKTPRAWHHKALLEPQHLLWQPVSHTQRGLVDPGGRFFRGAVLDLSTQPKAF